jgi:hypothetical protein
MTMIEQIRSTGLNSSTLYAASFASVALSIMIWLLRRRQDRANAERFGIFVGLWAPTLLQLGKIVEDAEKAGG